MKKLLNYPIAICLAAVLSFSTVNAQQNDAINDEIVITNPAAKVTIGAIFTVIGTINSDCQVYPYAGVYSQESGKNYVVPVLNRATGGNFSVRLNMAEAYNVDEYQNPKAEVPATGPVDVTIASDINNGCQHLLDDGSNTRTFQLQYSQVNPNPGQKPNVDAKVFATPTPSAIPTPSESPTASPFLEPVEKKTELSPALAMLIGAVAGGTIVGLSEYTAHRYQRRRKRKQ